jgi:biotin operon repressor
MIAMPIHAENAAELARLLKLIADETRLKILGALAEQPLTGADLADRLDLTPPTISHHMRKLTDAGIVTSETDAQRHWYRLNADFLLATRRTPIASTHTNPATEAGDSGQDAAFRNKVIRDFFVKERLRDIPAQRKKRVIVLQHIMQRFDPNRTYPETEVNDLLRPAHEDVATLRRELVDYGFMERDKGIYQVSRAGPQRSKQVAQEITGSEQTWLQSLLERVAQSPLDGK